MNKVYLIHYYKYKVIVLKVHIHFLKSINVFGNTFFLDKLKSLEINHFIFRKKNILRISMYENKNCDCEVSLL